MTTHLLAMAPSPAAPPPITLQSLAYRLLGHSLYREYLIFQREVHLPSSAWIYQSPDEWQTLRRLAEIVPHGCLPTLPVYCGFMNWINADKEPWAVRNPPQKDGSVHIAPGPITCSHTIHPAIHAMFAGYPACPSCLSERSISALVRAWESAESLVPVFDSAAGNPPEVIESANFALRTIKLIWRVEKLHWTKLVSYWEGLAAVEAAWEAAQAQGPYVFTAAELDEMESATKALRILWETDPRVDGALSAFVPGRALNARVRTMQKGPLTEEIAASQPVESDSLGSSSQALPSDSTSLSLLQSSDATSALGTSSQAPPALHNTVSANKSVTWAPNVLEYPRRRSWEYSRNSPLYSPGRHACPSAEGWEDTSWRSDPNWFVDRGYHDGEDESENLNVQDTSSSEEKDSDVNDGYDSDEGGSSVGGTEDRGNDINNNGDMKCNSDEGCKTDDSDDSDDSGHGSSDDDRDDDEEENEARKAGNGNDTKTSDQHKDLPAQNMEQPMSTNGFANKDNNNNEAQALTSQGLPGDISSTNETQLQLRSAEIDVSQPPSNPGVSTNGTVIHSTSLDDGLHAQQQVENKDRTVQETVVTDAANPSVVPAEDVYATLMQFRWPSSDSADSNDGRSARKRTPPESDDGDDLSPLSSPKRRKT